MIQGLERGTRFKPRPLCGTSARQEPPLTFDTYSSPSLVLGSVSTLKFPFSFPLVMTNLETQLGVLTKSLSSTGIRRMSLSTSFSFTLASY